MRSILSLAAKRRGGRCRVATSGLPVGWRWRRIRSTPLRLRWRSVRSNSLKATATQQIIGSSMPTSWLLQKIRSYVHAKILTGRESEIAQLAAIGESSKRIAERLFISVRTVDHHLASVYGKLGVSGRREFGLGVRT